MARSAKKLSMLIFIASVMFTTCTEMVASPISSPEIVETYMPTNTVILPAFTATSSPSPTLPRPTRTPTITPIPTPVRLAVPTLSNFEVDRLAQELLRINGSGCAFPCWWGIYPGVTSWDEAYRILSPFGDRVQEEKPWTICEESGCIQAVALGINFYPAVRAGVTIYIHDGVVARMYFNLANTNYHRLNQLLSEHGKPDQVYISTFESTPDGSLPDFYVVVYYEEKKILASYRFTGRKVGDMIKGCPLPVGPRLYAWSSNFEFSEEKMNNFVFGVDPTSLLQPLESVTDLSIEQFYLDFRDSLIPNCIETPAEFW